MLKKTLLISFFCNNWVKQSKCRLRLDIASTPLCLYLFVEVSISNRFWKEFKSLFDPVFKVDSPLQTPKKVLPKLNKIVQF